MFSKLTSPFAGLIFGLFCLLNNAAIAQKQPATLVGWDFQKNKAVLETAPRRSADATGIAFQIPLPDGEFHAATVLASPIFTTEAAAQLPDIQSYLVQGDGFHGRINTTPEGFFGYLLTREGSVLIQSDGSPNRYRVSKSDPSELRNFECSALRDQNLDDNAGEKQRGLLNISNGATLRTYHIAIVCTDEFEAANANPTLTATNTMTAINVIYESELAVHFDIAGIALENGTYNINTGGGASAYEAVKAVSAYFTNSASYDLGHVFHSPAGGGAGQAYLGAVCRNTSVGNPPVSPIKAGGWSGASNNNATWWYAILAHEIGHMFDAEHTFNGTASSCGGGNINAATSYEPGSGTTLMSYSGSCGTDNILIPGGTDPISQADTDDSHFHSTSLTDMITYFTSGNGSGCSTNTATGNTPPVGNANPGSQSNITIPKQTPFTLIGSATDANGDQLTYSWEQANPGPPHGSPGIAANSTSGPIFRTYPQTTSPARTFPALTYILNNANVVPNANLGEVLPGVARTLNFNFLVRDNRAGGGGTHCSPLTVTVSNNGPLAVTSPNTAISWAAGSTQAVTWNVNGTNNISTCANVNILLSINGGQSFPYVLVANTTNDGSQNVTIPTTIPATTQARIRVECNTGNVYIVPFDLSNVNFTITNGSCSAPPSAICPDAPVTAASGSNALNFSFENYVPTPTTSKTFAVSASDPLMTRCRWNNAVTACMTPGGTTNYQTFRFIVSQSGTYTFSFGSGNFRAAHLFANTFDPNNPCATFVASSVRDGAGYYTAIVSNTSGSPSIQLSACTEYFLVVVTEGFGGNTTVTFGGTGSIHELFTSPGGYDYTYVAVNQATDQVAAVSPTASFSGLGGGTYCVSGLSYLNSLNPNDFVGQSVATMLTNCVQLSANCKP
ncbi:MAG: M12 family metallo-peptidase, partial [Saprospiraceae bacterium]